MPVPVQSSHSQLSLGGVRSSSLLIACPYQFSHLTVSCPSDVFVLHLSSSHARTSSVTSLSVVPLRCSFFISPHHMPVPVQSSHSQLSLGGVRSSSLLITCPYQFSHLTLSCPSEVFVLHLSSLRARTSSVISLSVVPPICSFFISPQHMSVPVQSPHSQLSLRYVRSSSLLNTCSYQFSHLTLSCPSDMFVLHLSSSHARTSSVTSLSVVPPICSFFISPQHMLVPVQSPHSQLSLRYVRSSSLLNTCSYQFSHLTLSCPSDMFVLHLSSTHVRTSSVTSLSVVPPICSFFISPHHMPVPVQSSHSQSSLGCVRSSSLLIACPYQFSHLTLSCPSDMFVLHLSSSHARTSSVTSLSVVPPICSFFISPQHMLVPVQSPHSQLSLGYVRSSSLLIACPYQFSHLTLSCPSDMFVLHLSSSHARTSSVTSLSVVPRRCSFFISPHCMPVPVQSSHSQLSLGGVRSSSLLITCSYQFSHLTLSCPSDVFVPCIAFA